MLQRHSSEMLPRRKTPGLIHDSKRNIEPARSMLEVHVVTTTTDRPPSHQIYKDIHLRVTEITNAMQCNKPKISSHTQGSSVLVTALDMEDSTTGLNAPDRIATGDR